ncbi:MAG: outer membrane protein assembly factor BamA [Gammaproteobacteria bacterium]|nr:outer membrane protein assembly factor BamA [Gammaproteobacteria bacterium]
MFRFVRRFLLFVIFVFHFPITVFAQSFIVSEIYLENLQRVSSNTIFSVLNINIGDEVTQADVAEIIRNLMATESFNGVDVSQGDNNELIIIVDERPSISSVIIEGSDAIPEEILMENINSLGLSVGELFDPSVLEGLQLAMESQYVAQGLYGATVELDIEEQERNRVALQINISEGDPSKIVHINIVGNDAFSDEVLLELFELRETHFTSFLMGDDRYSREEITGDLESLQSFYMDQGFVNFDITLPVVSLSPNKDEVYITINVDEGEIYRINDVSLAGDLVGSEELLNELMTFVQQDQVFSQILVTQIAEAMTNTLSNRGYFFAEVNGVPIVDEEEGTVDVTFFVIPGNRTYVNRISFNGNTRTVDEVLRQEMRQMEGAPASMNAMEQSKVRLERLGYFSSVDYETAEVGGVTDQVDVDFIVEEQLSGSVNFSIGYAQVQGLTLSAQLQENNFLGTGKQVGVGVSTNLFSTNYQFSYIDPFYTVDGVSRGFSFNYTQSDYAELNLAAYSTNSLGANVNFGYPVNETQSLRFSLGITNTEIETGFGPVQEIKGSPELDPTIANYLVSPARLREFTDAGGNVFPIADGVTAPLSTLPSTAFREFVPGFVDREGNKFLDLTLTLDWSRNNLQQAGIFATGGSQQTFSIEFAIPGSQLSFYKMRLFGESFHPLNGIFPFLSPGWIFHLQGTFGFGDGYGGTEQLPFFRNFYAGGQNSIRGFERNTLGPRSTDGLAYLQQPTELLRDSNGNLILDALGNAQFNRFSEIVYALEQAVDANGVPLVDATGQPVFVNELEVQSLAFFTEPQPFGGNVQVTGTAEIIFPLGPLQARDTLRSSLFFDAGNVFSTYCTDFQISQNNCSDFSLEEFRYSAGIAVSWFTGYLGLMTLSFSKPFNSSIIDESEAFQFDIGNSF